VRRERLEFVRSRLEREAGEIRHLLGKLFRKADFGVQAGADGGTALGQEIQALACFLEPLKTQIKLRGIAGKFLAERQWRRVLGVGAADLDDVLEASCLVVQRIAQDLQGRHQSVMHLFGAGNVHGGGECVVRGLAAIDMIVGMDRGFGSDLAAKRFDGQIGNDLIGVHV